MNDFKTESMYESKKILNDIKDKEEPFDFPLIEWIVESIIDFKKRNGDV